MLDAPFFQIGSVEQITENIQAMRERWGISYVLFQSDGTVPMGPVVAAPRRHLRATSRSCYQIGGAAGPASVPIAAARCWMISR